MITLNGSAPDLLGLSTDTKPDDAFINSLFLELDTGNFYYFNGEEWAKVGESADSTDAGKTLNIAKPVLGKTVEKPAEDPEEETTEEEQPEEAAFDPDADFDAAENGELNDSPETKTE